MNAIANPFAFPFPKQRAGEIGVREGSDGMTLRDHFAGLALPAIIVATSAGQHMPLMDPGEINMRMALARDAYAMADAMLAARAIHASDCATHNAPAMEPGPCDCGAS
jgi:hypothetical protein